MSQQQPPPHAFPNYGYMQQQQQQQQFHQNGQQNLVNGFPQMAPQPNQQQQQQQPMKPIPAQQLPPQQQQQQPQPTINYQNFQTNALHGTPQPLVASGLNGSNSALSSRTSSPGVQPAMIPTSQLPPSKSYPSYQPLVGQQQQPMTYPQQTGVLPQQNQQQAKPPSQFPTSMAPPVVTNNNSNNNNGEPNPATSSMPQQLSASMKNLSMNPVPTFPSAAPSMPSSKSDQNLLNNNNMQQPTRPSMNMQQQKRPMYPQQTMPPMAQQQQQPMAPMTQQPQAQTQQQFNSFPGLQQPQMQPGLQQPPQMQPNLQNQAQQPSQPRSGNLQYQNFPQQQQQAQPQQQEHHPQLPGGVVQQGFNRIWGRETVDLMQHRHILPQTKVLPPTVKLNHQFQEAVNCNSEIFRCTLTKIPESNSLLQKSRLPLGILIHPFRDLSVSVSFILLPYQMHPRFIIFCFFL